jgi:dihydrofolate synthase / folylpolyglutamate synthase
MQITRLVDVPALLQQKWPATVRNRHRMTLEYMRQLMEVVGNPQHTYKVIHVAGTSGKTSTAMYAAALLHAAGKRVGLTISPHVDYINERVQIDMVPLSEAVYCRELTIFTDLIERAGLKPSYFEMIYAFAFWELARQRVEYAVVEVGVGGLLDSTNVIERPDKVCIITDIGYDHMSILGNTLTEIATQKAGIIQFHNAVFCWQQSDEIMAPIYDAVRRQQADIHALETPGLPATFHFLPLFQRRNFELALTAVKEVLRRDSSRPMGHKAQLAAAHTPIPARMEIFYQAGKTIIIDASHNPQKLHALAVSIREQFPDQPIAALAAFVQSKTAESRVDGGMRELMALADHLVLTSFIVPHKATGRSVDPELMARVCAIHGYKTYEVIKDPVKAFQALVDRPEPVVLVAGSFFLLNHIRPLLRRV